MKKIHRQHVAFEVEAEDVGVLVVRGRDALLVLHLVHGHDLVAQPRRELKLHVLRRGLHARGQRLLQLVRLAVQKELHIANRLPVELRRRQPLDARAETSLDVVLQAGAGMVAREIDLAAGDEKAAVYQVDEAVCEVTGEVRSEIK